MATTCNFNRLFGVPLKKTCLCANYISLIKTKTVVLQNTINKKSNKPA